jgi:plasmid stability protein
MEEEVRDILRNAVKEGAKTEKGLGSRIAARFRGLGITEEIQELRGYPAKPAKLD